MIPHAWNLGEAPGWSSQSQRCHLFYLFFQVQIRVNFSPPVEEPWGGDIDINAVIGYAHRDYSRIIGNPLH